MRGVTVSSHFYYKVDPFGGDKTVNISKGVTLSGGTVTDRACTYLEIHLVTTINISLLRR